MPESLYDTDFFAWTQQQAKAVRAGVWDDIDRDPLAEEIADGWKRDSHLLWQHLRGVGHMRLCWLMRHAPNSMFLA